MSARRATYHTDLKLAFVAGMLPANLSREIPRSTKCNWRTQDLSKIVGFKDPEETRREVRDWSDLQDMPRLKRIVHALIRANRRLRELLASVRGSRKAMDAMRERIVSDILRCNDAARRHVLRWFGVSAQRLTHWLRNARACPSSLLRLCRSRHPHQLTEREILSIARYLADSAFACWPLVSIWYRMLRDAAAFCGLTTFYKYARALGFPKAKGRFRKTHGEGIRADRPGQILHPDVTELRLSDGAKMHLHMLMDNFSRYVFSARPELRKDSRVTWENLVGAVTQFPDAFREEILLVTDGGSENAGAVDRGIVDMNRAGELVILRKVAQRDIQESNSMVEAYNRTYKHYYVRDREFGSPDALSEHAEASRVDFNMRPHSALFGLTPHEALHGESPDPHRFLAGIRNARQSRIAGNKAVDCATCAPLAIPAPEVAPADETQASAQA